VLAHCDIKNLLPKQPEAEVRSVPTALAAGCYKYPQELAHVGALQAIAAAAALRETMQTSANAKNYLDALIAQKCGGGGGGGGGDLLGGMAHIQKLLQQVGLALHSRGVSDWPHGQWTTVQPYLSHSHIFWEVLSSHNKCSANYSATSS
jgi:hypothetical protein